MSEKGAQKPLKALIDAEFSQVYQQNHGFIHKMTQKHLLP